MHTHAPSSWELPDPYLRMFILFYLFPLTIFFLIVYKDISDYICNDKNILAAALSPDRLFFTSDDEEYDEVHEEIKSCLQVQHSSSNNYGLWWNGTNVLPKNTLVAWYTGCICLDRKHSSAPLPKDVT